MKFNEKTRVLIEKFKWVNREWMEYAFRLNREYEWF